MVSCDTMQHVVVFVYHVYYNILWSDDATLYDTMQHKSAVQVGPRPRCRRRGVHVHGVPIVIITNTA